MSSAVSLVWFRQDLRLTDNPALTAAARRGIVIPVYVWDPLGEVEWTPGGACQWWLHHSLAALDASLRELGSGLVIRRGSTQAVLIELLRETGATAVFWNRRYEPAAMARDALIKGALKSAGYQAESFNGALLYEPWTIQNQAGKPFQVFTPFWRHCRAQPTPAAPLPRPVYWPAPKFWPRSEALELKPQGSWARAFGPAWTPGEQGATRAWEFFCAQGWADYTERRNRPDLPGTSRLSPHLHFGEISPRQIFAQLARLSEAVGDPKWCDRQFVTEVGWREFAHHLLFHFPHTPTEPLRPDFARFPWRVDPVQLTAWQRGQTGYPIVDAGMRELWSTGWMHNRVRMIVASFLVKNLRISWVAGARWFWDTLVDADLAQNTLGWQWSAGCGADAAPYFRIFNPMTQGMKFDPAGDYVRRWVPELARLPGAYVQAPWTAPALELAQSGVFLGRNYPKPLVDHAVAREAALAAFQELKRPTAEPMGAPAPGILAQSKRSRTVVQRKKRTTG